MRTQDVPVIDERAVADACNHAVATGLPTAIAHNRQLTVAEFLAWTGPEGRSYQLIDGAIIMMAPARTAHGKLLVRMASALDEALADRPDLTTISDAGIIRPDRDDQWYEADLVVAQEPVPDDALYVRSPVVVVEILSPSTEGIDRRIKLPDYQAVPTVQEIVLIHHDRAMAEVHRRQAADRWTVIQMKGLEATLTLSTVPVSLPLARLYRDLTVST